MTELDWENFIAELRRPSEPDIDNPFSPLGDDREIDLKKVLDIAENCAMLKAQAG